MIKLCQSKSKSLKHFGFMFSSIIVNNKFNIIRNLRNVDSAAFVGKNDPDNTDGNVKNPKRNQILIEYFQKKYL